MPTSTRTTTKPSPSSGLEKVRQRRFKSRRSSRFRVLGLWFRFGHAERGPHSDQVDQGFRLHLLHDMAAVDLERVTRARPSCILCPCPTLPVTTRPLVLRFRRAVVESELRFDFCWGECDLLARSSGSVSFNPGLDGVQHILLAQRLGQQLDRAGFYRPHRNRDITMGTDENHRKVYIELAQYLLKLQTAPSRQSGGRGQCNPAHQGACCRETPGLSLTP